MLRREKRLDQELDNTLTDLTEGTAMPTAQPDMTLNTRSMTWLLVRLDSPMQRNAMRKRTPEMMMVSFLPTVLRRTTDKRLPI